MQYLTFYHVAHKLTLGKMPKKLYHFAILSPFSVFFLKTFETKSDTNLLNAYKLKCVHTYKKTHKIHAKKCRNILHSLKEIIFQVALLKSFEDGKKVELSFQTIVYQRICVGIIKNALFSHDSVFRIK